MNLNEIDVEHYRPYLRYLARQRLGSTLRAKTDESSLVQDVFLDLHRNRHRFAKLGTSERMAYVRAMLANALKDKWKYFGRGKRDVMRERSIEESLCTSSAQLGEFLAANDSSPSDVMMREERLLQLASALEQLPQNQQLAVELKVLSGLTIQKTADQMGVSVGAVAGLVTRGLKSLRQLLKESEDAE